MQMKGFSRSILGQLCRRPPVGFFICSTPPPAVSRRAAPFITASSALQSPLSRFDFGPWSMQRYFGVESENKLGKRRCTTAGSKPSSKAMKEMQLGRIEDTQSNLIHQWIKD